MSIPHGERQPTLAITSGHVAPAAQHGPCGVAQQIALGQPPSWVRSFAWLAVLIWAGTIFWFSSRTGAQIEEMNVFELSDKVVHFIAFFAGAPAVFLALTWSFRWAPKRAILVSILALAFYGAADEYHQTFTAARTGADVWDWTGDAFGGLAGTLVCGFVYDRFLRRKDSHPPAPRGD